MFIDNRQENKSSRIMELFRDLVPQTALVVRDGVKTTLPADQLTVGDVVHVQFGDRIPADLRLIDCTGFKVFADWDRQPSRFERSFLVVQYRQIKKTTGTCSSRLDVSPFLLISLYKELHQVLSLQSLVKPG